MERVPGFVDLGCLDWEDLTFAVPSFQPHTRLEASLERCGILTPPWVWERAPGRFTVVDGFKRLLWAQKNGRERVECFIFPETSDGMALRVRRIEAKLAGRPLNPAEKARVVLQLSDVLPPERILADFFPLLDLPARPGGLETWRRLALAETPLLEALAAEDLSERSALELIGWEEEARAEALRLLKTLRCSASIQMELLERVTEIAEREERERAELLREPALREILEHASWNHRQKTQALRELLTRLRFPRLKAREERFRQELAAAALPEVLRLVPPAAFEGERWRLELSFTRPEELQAALDSARVFAGSSALKKIMAPKGEREPGGWSKGPKGRGGEL